jgi:hypothetical protein
MEAYDSHPTWKSEFDTLPLGWTHIIRVYKLEQDRVKAQSQAAAVEEVLGYIKALTTKARAAQDMEPHEKPIMVNLPPMEDWVMEASNGMPGRMGRAVIEMFAALSGKTADE